MVREREGVDGNLTLEEDDKLIEFGIEGIGCCWYFGFGICETVNPVGNVVKGGDATAKDIAE